ncbi:conserved hypothetical protein [Candidatus Terasakiella magnetica]|nr:conserved hypothetical protein [Candidatus Terasakiella magnetica]
MCCAAEPCPASILVFRRLRGSCPALTWEEAAGRYWCGLAVDPSRYLRWLPSGFAVLVGRLVRRWIAAGIGCDSRAPLAP